MTWALLALLALPAAAIETTPPPAIVAIEDALIRPATVEADVLSVLGPSTFGTQGGTTTFRADIGGVAGNGGLGVAGTLSTTSSITARGSIEQITAAGSSPAYIFKDGDVAQPDTGSGSADTVGRCDPFSSIEGGYSCQGFSDTNGISGILLTGRVGGTAPTVGAVVVRGSKSNGGTGAANTGDGEILFQAQKNDGTQLVTVAGNGNLTTVSTFSVRGVDTNDGAMVRLVSPQAYGVLRWDTTDGANRAFVGPGGTGNIVTGSAAGGVVVVSADELQFADDGTGAIDMTLDGGSLSLHSGTMTVISGTDALGILVKNTAARATVNVRSVENAAAIISLGDTAEVGQYNCDKDASPTCRLDTNGASYSQGIFVNNVKAAGFDAAAAGGNSSNVAFTVPVDSATIGTHISFGGGTYSGAYGREISGKGNDSAITLECTNANCGTANSQRYAMATSYDTDANSGSLGFRDLTNSATRLSIRSNGNVGIGTSRPETKLHMSSGTLTVDGNATDAARFTGHVVSTGTAPSLSSCGTSPTIDGTDTAGKVTIGSAPGTTCVLTFATAYSSKAPACISANETTTNLTRPVSSTTALTINGTFLGGDVVNYICFGAR